MKNNGRTYLVNHRGGLVDYADEYREIICGTFRGYEVVISNDWGVFKLEVENDLGFFDVIFKSNNKEEVIDFYLSTYGMLGKR